MSKYDALISGSDLRAQAIGDDAPLCPELARTIGRAFAAWCLKRAAVSSQSAGEYAIAIGRDSRLTGEALLDACAEGMAEMGVQVRDLGLSTTPAMFRCLMEEEPVADASVMVTASHHPSDRNGFKFLTPAGGITSADIRQIVDLMENLPLTADQKGTIQAYDYTERYKEHLTHLVQDNLEDPVSRPLLGLHVLVDAGNGSGGFFASWLEELGAWTEGSQYLEPDGNFPGHIPNPEDDDAMASLGEAVKRHTADLGVIFDADCDRVGLVDCTGKALNRNRLIALTAAMLLDDEPGLTIVTDSVTSTGLTKFIGSWGGEHYRYKRGYRNVIDEAKRLNESGINCPLAIETSGHAALRDNDFLDDGMYLATLLICEAMRLKREGKCLDSLLEGLQEPVESAELRLNILAEDFRSAGLRLIEEVMDHAEADGNDWKIAPDNREGIRITFDLDQKLDSAWFLLRLSVHDPVMALNAESDVPGGVKLILSELHALIGDMPDIDFAPLLDYIG